MLEDIAQDLSRVTENINNDLLEHYNKSHQGQTHPSYRVNQRFPSLDEDYEDVSSLSGYAGSGDDTDSTFIEIRQKKNQMTPKRNNNRIKTRSSSKVRSIQERPLPTPPGNPSTERQGPLSPQQPAPDCQRRSSTRRPRGKRRTAPRRAASDVGTVRLAEGNVVKHPRLSANWEDTTPHLSRKKHAVQMGMPHANHHAVQMGMPQANHHAVPETSEHTRQTASVLKCTKQNKYERIEQRSSIQQRSNVQESCHIVQSSCEITRRETILSRQQVERDMVNRRSDCDRLSYRNGLISSNHMRLSNSNLVINQSNDKGVYENISGSNVSLNCGIRDKNVPRSALQRNSDLQTTERKEHIPLENRLLVTEAVWLLKEITRESAVICLRHHRPGCFIVRQSRRRSCSLVLSVKSTELSHVDHYIIHPPLGEENISIDGATQKFPTLLELILHYSRQRDDLPLQLRLPTALHEAETLQQLNEFTLLGQRFWTNNIHQPCRTEAVQPFTHLSPPALLNRLTSSNYEQSSSYVSNHSVAHRNAHNGTGNINRLSIISQASTASSINQYDTTKHLHNSTHRDGVPAESRRPRPSSMSASQSSLYTNGDVWSSLDDVGEPSQQSSTTVVVQCNSLPRHKSPVVRSPVMKSPTKKPEHHHTSVVQSQISAIPQMFTNGFHDDSLDLCSESSVELDGMLKANMSCASSEMSLGRNPPRRTHRKQDNCARLCEKYNLAYDSESSSLSYDDGSTSDTSYKGSMAPNFVSLKKNSRNVYKRKEPEVFTFETTSADETSSYNNDRREDLRKSEEIENADDNVSSMDGTTSSCSESFDAKICRIFNVPRTHLSHSAQNGDTSQPEYFNNLNILNDTDFITGEHGFSDAVFGSESEARHRLLLHESAQHVIEAVNRLSHHLSSQTTPPTSGDPLIQTNQQAVNIPISHVPTAYLAEPVLPVDAKQEETSQFNILMKKIVEKYGSSQDISEPCQTGSHLPRYSYNGEITKRTTELTSLHVPQMPIRAQSVPKQMNQSYMSSQKSRLYNADASSDSEVELQPIRPQSSSISYAVNGYGSRSENHSQVQTRQFPIASSRPRSSVSDVTTIDDVISDVSPELTMKPIQVRELTLRNVKRLSDYDNMGEELAQHVQACAGTPARTAASSAGTFYCSPWDSSLWDDIINLGTTSHQRNQHHHVTSPLAQAHPLKTPTDYHSDVEYNNVTLGQSMEIPETVEPVQVAPVFSSPPIVSSHQPSEECSQGQSRNYIVSTNHYNNHNEKILLPQQSVISSSSTSTQTPRVQSSASYSEVAIQTPVGDDTPASPSGASCVSGISHLSSFSTHARDNIESVDDPTEVTTKQEDADALLQEASELVLPRPKVQRAELSPPRLMSLRRRASSGAGENIRQFIYKLSNNHTSWFGASVDKFIHCTEEGTEASPHVVIRNVRQYMNGMKNYLVCNKEGGLYKIIEQESAKLKGNEFLNVDAILESALHRCILGPLKQHIYKVFVSEYKRSGSLEQLSENIKYARTRTPQQLGIRSDLSPPSHNTMEIFRHFMEKMQRAFSPLKKLENLLGATSAIYACVQNPVQVESLPEGVSLGADDFLPMFIYALSHCGVVSAEIEADYMWGLLHPCLVAGEGGYHLTTLSSAVHVLKNLKTATTMVENEQNTTLSKQHMGSVSDLQGFIKIVIPDELYDSISVKTLPVRPTMTCQQVADMIANKFRITNPQNYGLYVVVDGIEDSLQESSLPQGIQTEIMDSGRDCVFAYKRNNAKFAWPKNFT